MMTNNTTTMTTKTKTFIPVWKQLLNHVQVLLAQPEDVPTLEIVAPLKTRLRAVVFRFAPVDHNRQA